MSPRTIPELNAAIESQRRERTEVLHDARVYRKLVASPYATEETRQGLSRGIAACVSIARYAHRQLLDDKRQIRLQTKRLAGLSR